MSHPLDNQPAAAAWALRNSDRAAARALVEPLRGAEAGDPLAAAPAQVVISYLDFCAHRYAAAAAAGIAALAVLEAGPADVWLPRLYSTLAGIYGALGERDTCSHYLDRQIRLSHLLGDREGEAMGYRDLGVQQAVVDPQRGLVTLSQAREIFQAIGSAEGEATTLYQIARIYHQRGDGRLAADHAAQALLIAQSNGLRPLLITLAIHLAAVADTRGHHTEARRHLSAAHDLVRASLPELLPLVQIAQGRHLIAAGDLAAAHQRLSAALAQIDEAGHKELLADCHAALADCYERQDDHRAALAHYKSYVAASESLFREASEQKVRALDVIHRTEATRREADLERRRNAELQHYIRELEQLHAALRETSLRDPLTGLHNRRYLTDEGARLLRHAQRYQTAICAAMIDVDYFKRINDQLQHQIGDLVLQRLAEIITQAMRVTDLVARYGGEEFSALLPETGLDAAYIACERLREAVEQHAWADIHPLLQVTISIGLAESGGSTSIDELLARADSRLYDAKRAGRNRTVF